MKYNKVFLFVLGLYLLNSCEKDSQMLIENLNGYWEIETVTFPNGEIKEYKYNDLIDYISINDSLQGFRKKIKPSFDGTFSITNDAEGITMKIENDSLNLYYSTPYASWKETIIDVSENHLKLINQNKNVYLYKRYKAIDLSIEE